MVRRSTALAVLVFLLLATAQAWAHPGAPVQIVTSPGGIVAWLVEDHSNPLVSLSLGFRGGGAADPVGKEGLAEFASGLMDEGAGEIDSKAFQQRLADLAMDFSFDAGVDNFTGRMRALSENRDAGFDLLRLALTAPRFDPPAVERIRGQLQARLADDASNADVLADRLWWRLAFPHHSYGRPLSGTQTSLKSITPDDLKAFARRRFARDNLVLAVVGDISAKDLGPLLDLTFGALPATAEPVAVPEVAPVAGGDVVVAEREVPQSVILFGQPGLKREDPDFYAAYLVNHILGGGGFGSRLTAEVREKRGLAYSIDTGLVALDHVGLIQGSAGTQNARAAETLDLIRGEWARMRDDGPTEKELADAKTYIIGSFALRFDSSLGIARLLVGLQLDGFGPDYLANRKGYFDSVTLADAKRVAKSLLDPAKLVVVVVGRPDGITATQATPSPD